MNYKMMGKFLSQILIVEAGFMVPALLISLYTGSRAAVYGFGLSILITAGVGALMYYFAEIPPVVFAREAMVCVAGSWIAISFFGCLPFVFSRKFQTLSMPCLKLYRDFTTTGFFDSGRCGSTFSRNYVLAEFQPLARWHGGTCISSGTFSERRERQRVYHASAACGESGTECEQAGAENAYNSKNFVRHIHGADIHQFPVSPVGKNAGFLMPYVPLLERPAQVDSESEMTVLQDTAHIYRMYVRYSCFCLESTSAVIICF